MIYVSDLLTSGVHDKTYLLKVEQNNYRSHCDDPGIFLFKNSGYCCFVNSLNVMLIYDSEMIGLIILRMSYHAKYI